jgi:hypothetical protein
MILYKYRSLENLEYVLDLILNQRLHCSTYPELNDPFEGIFETTIHPMMVGLFATTPSRRRALFELRRKTYKKVEDFFEGDIDRIKICSLSSDLSDVRLWSYYADGHKGISFEIDCSGLEKIYEVRYSEKLLQGSISLLGGTSITEALSHKTNHWAFESEYRIIDESKHLSKGKYFDIKSRVKAIYLGTRTSDDRRELLLKIVQGKIPIWTTKLNNKKVIVEPDKLIEE